MAQLSKKGLIRFNVDNKEVNAPIQWGDLSILMTYEGGNNQANVSITEIEIADEGAKAFVDYVNEGRNGGLGIFEGLPVQFVIFNKDAQHVVDMYADLTDGYREELWRSRVFVNLVKKDGLNTLDNLVNGLSYGFLADKGVFTRNDSIDVNYVIEKNYEAIEILLAAITLYLMTKELVESAERTADAINSAAAYLAAGATGGLAATIYTVGKAVITSIYTAAMLAIVVQLATDLFNTFLPPLRTHKVLSYRKMIEKVVNYLGYPLNTSITELDNYYNLPSNFNFDTLDPFGFIKKTEGTKSGIPQTQDSNYLVSSFFSQIRDMFFANFAIVSGVVELHNRESDFWKAQSSYVMPSVLEKPKEYNTNDLVALRNISFATDVKDEYTISNFTGTNYEINTDARVVKNRDAKFIKGFDNINIPVSLGNRRDELSPLESALSVLAGVVDKVTVGVTNFKKRIENKIGSLKVSSNNTNVKVLYLKNGKLPQNHRTFLSAKYLYDKYGTYNSFVENNFGGQKAVFNNINIPFGFSDFLQMIDSNYFTDDLGKESQAESVEYNVKSDRATISYTNKEVYTTNLIETKREG